MKQIHFQFYCTIQLEHFQLYIYTNKMTHTFKIKSSKQSTDTNHNPLSSYANKPTIHKSNFHKNNCIQQDHNYSRDNLSDLSYIIDWLQDKLPQNYSQQNIQKKSIQQIEMQKINQKQSTKIKQRLGGIDKFKISSTKKSEITQLQKFMDLEIRQVNINRNKNQIFYGDKKSSVNQDYQRKLLFNSNLDQNFHANQSVKFQKQFQQNNQFGQQSKIQNKSRRRNKIFNQNSSKSKKMSQISTENGISSKASISEFQYSYQHINTNMNQVANSENQQQITIEEKIIIIVKQISELNINIFCNKYEQFMKQIIKFSLNLNVLQMQNSNKFQKIEKYQRDKFKQALQNTIRIITFIKTNFEQLKLNLANIEFLVQNFLKANPLQKLIRLNYITNTLIQLKETKSKSIVNIQKENFIESAKYLNDFMDFLTQQIRQISQLKETFNIEQIMRQFVHKKQSSIQVLKLTLRNLSNSCLDKFYKYQILEYCSQNKIIF